MRTKVSILFYAKRAKASVNCLIPINTRITINWDLDNLKSKILYVEKNLIKKDILVNFQTFKNALTVIKERERIWVPILQEHSRIIKKLVGQEYASGTLERYATSLKHIAKFLEWKNKVWYIERNKIDHAL